jgi:transketolase
MKRHDSMRGWFAYELYLQMQKNKNIILLTGDLGYKVFDAIRDEMPEQFINCGAAEQAMMGMAVGLAIEGKIPVVYSITTFLLYRPFETIRTYINHEKLNVKLIGAGREKDYTHDGISHWSDDAWKLFDMADDYGNEPMFNNIRAFWPDEKEEIPGLVKEMLETKEPYFLSLRR